MKTFADYKRRWNERSWSDNTINNMINLCSKNSRPNAEALISAMNHLSVTVQENESSSHCVVARVSFFEFEATRLCVEQLRFAIACLKTRRQRPSFKRSLQFSTEAISIELVFCSRGAGADLPIRSNEAMASQWKQGLITLVYLRVQSGSQFVRQPVSRQLVTLI